MATLACPILSTTITTTRLVVPNLQTSPTRTLTRPTRNGKLPLKAVTLQSFEKGKVAEEEEEAANPIPPITITIIHQEEEAEEGEVLTER